MNLHLNYNKTLFLITVLTMLSLPILSQKKGNEDRYVKNSVLALGNWSKIKVNKTGVYKLTYDDLLNMGISNPKNVQIYGYGGWVLEENFTLDFIDDLPQIAIWMSKPRAEFSSGDYILFYAKGDIKWWYDQTKKEFLHTQNPYSFDSYYFVTESEDGALLMEEENNSSEASITIDKFTDYYLHEKELVNIEQSGREFYGESFQDISSQDFQIKLQGVTSDSAIIRCNFIAKMKSKTIGSTLELKNNNISLAKKNIPYKSDTKFDILDDTTLIKNISENNTINLTYNKGNSSDKNLHLNYLIINYYRKLKPYGGVTLFRSKTQSSKLGFKISDATDKIIIFDVTQSEIPKVITTKLSGTNLSFTASNTTIKEYAMVNLTANDIPTPIIIGKVQNQNLHGLESKEMVIIVQPLLIKYAQELANIHKEDSGLESLIVTPEEIYNEFSSGKPDVTAYRRFLKMFYDRASGDSSKYPQYLLLFGDGSYDNRFVLTGWSESLKKSAILTYQTANSNIEEYSFVTDDYMGFLDDNEGIKIESDVLDLGVGRIVVRTESEAAGVVNKIKRYIKNEDKGIWKNNIGFYADDALVPGKDAIEKMHVKDTDEFTDSIRKYYPEFIVNKLYQDNYDRIVTPNGARYPNANKALIDKINSGLLVLNYLGHGSTKIWTHEEVFTSDQVQNLKNTRLPLWITATCDYSRFDAVDTSAGEIALLNPNGGAIALFSTTRVVYAERNKPLNQSILNHIFEKKNNKPLRLGDILRNAKKISGNNKLKFMLLGDPALRLSYPDETYKVKIIKINDKDAITSEDIKIKALDNNTLKGIIVDKNDYIVTDFSGKLETVIFDSKLTQTTKGNKTSTTVGDPKFSYSDYINTIYSGSTDILNGQFTINFVTPKDILYTDDLGLMNFYAYADDNEREAQGSYQNYKVGGISDNLSKENNPPIITKMYLNNQTFQSGDKVSSNPTFYAEFSDDTGVNLSSGIGHNISLVINGIKSYNLTPYFEPKSGVFNEGSVKFTIPDLETGNHTLQFKVWDSWNNSASKSFDFEVINEYKAPKFDFQIQENPTKDDAHFIVKSDDFNSNIIIKYQVYTLSGELLWSDEDNNLNQSYIWDLKNNNGEPLDAGTYICRVSISADGVVKMSTSEKLIITKQ